MSVLCDMHEHRDVVTLEAVSLHSTRHMQVQEHEYLLCPSSVPELADTEKSEKYSCPQGGTCLKCLPPGTHA